MDSLDGGGLGSPTKPTGAGLPSRGADATSATP